MLRIKTSSFGASASPCILSVSGKGGVPRDGGAGDPPAGDPPAGDPPAGDPPAGDPPAGNFITKAEFEAAMKKATDDSHGALGRVNSSVNALAEQVKGINVGAGDPPSGDPDADAIKKRQSDEQQRIDDDRAAINKDRELINLSSIRSQIRNDMIAADVADGCLDAAIDSVMLRHGAKLKIQTDGILGTKSVIFKEDEIAADVPSGDFIKTYLQSQPGLIRVKSAGNPAHGSSRVNPNATKVDATKYAFLSQEQRESGDYVLEN